MEKRNAFLLLCVAVLQWLVPVLPVLGLGENVGARTMQDGIGPELPPGIFFAIWSVIFTAYLIFALLAVLKPTFLEHHLGPPLLIAGAGNVAWMLAAQFIGNDWLNFVLLCPILVFAWEAAHRLHRMGGWDGTARRLNAVVLTGLLSGWLAVAISISIPELVRQLRGLEASDQVWISLWLALVPAGLLAWSFASRVSRGLWFFVALAWGISGIAINNWTRLGTHFLAIAAVCVGLYILWRRLAYGARPAFQ